MENNIPALRTFLERFQSDDALQELRQFVNVYTPHEEDIAAIHSGNYDIANLQVGPSPYGAGTMYEFSVGHTTFRIWGRAAQYIESANKDESAKY